MAKQTIASDSILNTTGPDGAAPTESALTEAGLNGSAATREVLKCALSSTPAKGIVTEHRSP